MASHVVLLGYPVYPFGGMDDQKQAVIDGIYYLREKSHLKHLFQHSTSCPTQGHSRKSNQKPLVVSGHSSGAHISITATLSSLLAGKSLGVDFILGLAGPYDIVDHYVFESNRNVQDLSPMKPAAGGIDNFFYHSPSRVAAHADFKPLLEQKFGELQGDFPYIGLIHGEDDTTVPPSSSEKLQQAMTGFGATARLHIPKDYGHMSCLLDLVDETDNATKRHTLELWQDFLDNHHHHSSSQTV